MNEISNDKDKLALALGALKFIDDPEIGLNVVDLGLIYQIDFDENAKRLFCSHSLTTQFCPMGETINSGIRNALENTFPDFEVETKITFDPPWNSKKFQKKDVNF
jgi:metal-sulfur cluster biosynthetic enzyme